MAEPDLRNPGFGESFTGTRRLRIERKLPAANGLLVTAEKVGNLVGTVASLVQHMPVFLEKLKHKLTVIRGRAGRSTAESAEEWERAMRGKLRNVQEKAARVARERPLQIIFAAGAMAFVLGVTLRVWRANRE